jgi:hypothetical protein
MTSTPDPATALVRAALERQAAVLAPVAARLHAAAAHPPTAPPDWRGPAADAFADRELRLRRELAEADAAANASLAHTRAALAALSSVGQAGG